ncbi:MAG TPA: ABC transporter permease [Nitrolancea sp.]
MNRFIVQRITQIPILLFIVSIIIFSLLRVTPGDPVQIMMGSNSDPALEESIRHQLHLDEPLPVQYVEWISGVAHGDLGRSIRTREPVLNLIAGRLLTTLSLAVAAMILSLAIAIPVGILAATHHNSPLDYGLMFVATLAWSIPNFVVAILLVVVVSVHFGWLPISGSGNLFTDPGGSWRYFLMPVFSLGLSRAAVMSRMLRSSLLEVLRRDYIRTATAKGLRTRTVLIRHALKNALLPVITIAAINFGYLLGGAVVVEQIFGIAGIGSLLIQAVFARDFPVIQGIALFTAVTFIVANLLADFLYGVFDPRIRES